MKCNRRYVSKLINTLCMFFVFLVDRLDNDGIDRENTNNCSFIVDAFFAEKSTRTVCANIQTAFKMLGTSRRITERKTTRKQQLNDNRTIKDELKLKFEVVLNGEQNDDRKPVIGSYIMLFNSYRTKHFCNVLMSTFINERIESVGGLMRVTDRERVG